MFLQQTAGLELHRSCQATKTLQLGNHWPCPLEIHLAILVLMPAECRNDVAPLWAQDLPHASSHTSRDGNLIEHSKFYRGVQGFMAPSIQGTEWHREILSMFASCSERVLETLVALSDSK